MAKGDYSSARGYFERAQAFTPNYPLLEINLGIAEGGMLRDTAAEAHFRRAIALAPNDAPPYFYYARWLRERGRAEESVAGLLTAIAKNPEHFDSRYLLMQTYAERRDWGPLEALAAGTLKIAPQDAAALRYREAARTGARSSPAPTAEGQLELSLAHYRAGRYQECIAAAKEALRLKPGYAEAYNNIAAASNAMARWDDGVIAAQQAIRLKPDFQLAKNNLAWAQSQKNAAKR